MNEEVKGGITDVPHEAEVKGGITEVPHEEEGQIDTNTPLELDEKPDEADPLQQMKEQAAQHAAKQQALCKEKMERSRESNREFIQNFGKIQDDLGKDIKEIQEKIEALKTKLTQNQYDAKSKKGYLRSKMDDYFACLKLDSQKFAQLLLDDHEAW